MTAAGFLTGVVVCVAFGAWLVAAWSAFQAWRIAERHPPYRALGYRRYINWMGSLPFLPPEARPHMARFAKAFAVFFLALIAGIATGLVSARS